METFDDTASRLQEQIQVVNHYTVILCHQPSLLWHRKYSNDYMQRPGSKYCGKYEWSLKVYFYSFLWLNCSACLEQVKVNDLMVVLFDVWHLIGTVLKVEDVDKNRVKFYAEHHHLKCTSPAALLNMISLGPTDTSFHFSIYFQHLFPSKCSYWWVRGVQDYTCNGASCIQ